jgi:hypothetical protein
MWAREGSEGIWSSCVFFETSHRKEDVSSLVSRRQGGDEVTGSTDIAGLAGWIFKLIIRLDRAIHYV